MDKNIEELSTEEIQSKLAELDTKLNESVAPITDEEEFPSDTLIDAVTMIHYLSRSGAVEQAEAVYSNLYKTFIIETVRRLGELPYL